jgi:Holliday junction DNA helicase RuvA
LPLNPTMIDTIRGIVTDIRETCLVVETGGIGYRIFVTSNVATEINLGDNILLHTSFLIRDDRQYLYGFRNRIERELFDVLLTVSGIGAKTALALLGLQADQLIMSISAGDETPLRSIPGIGPKTAKRVILELRDRLGKEIVGELEALAGIRAMAAGEMLPSDVSSEALDALLSLGYDRAEAVQRLRMAKSKLGDDAKLEDLIGAALKRE